MKSKRLISILLAGVMLTGCLAGCNKTPSESKKENEEAVVTQGVVTTEKNEETKATQGVITDPITFDILVRKDNTDAVDVDQMWFFKYLEWWMNQQGYNITLNVTTSSEIEQQVSLLLATDALPDLVWGHPLTTNDVVTYGTEEGMLLDWTPYLNEETMPEIAKLDAKYPDVLQASKCNDGAVYGLPTFQERTYGWAAGNFPGMNLHIHLPSLEAVGAKMPTTMDEFVDVLRLFKDNLKTKSGDAVTPLLNGDNFEKYIWLGLGYYGSYQMTKYGQNFLIKDGEVYLPAATEDYRTFIQYMNAMYTEGLIHEDYITMDANTRNGLIMDMTAPVMEGRLDELFPETYTEWDALPPLTVGDNDTVAFSANSTYRLNRIWASAKTEYPEVLAYMLNYVYSPEGSLYYYNGPMKGEDPLDLLDDKGWYFNEEGAMCNAATEAGEAVTTFEWALNNVFPSTYMANYIDYVDEAKKMAGLETVVKTEKWPDAILGEPYEVIWRTAYSPDTASGYWRLSCVDAWKNNMTTVALPSVYWDAEDVSRVDELGIVINDYITTESAKFITGIRPLTEIDDYFEELKNLHVDEYIQLHRDGYAAYLEEIIK